MIATLPTIADLRRAWAAAEQRADLARLAAQRRPTVEARQRRAQATQQAAHAWQAYRQAGGSLEEDAE